jgi:hypothetical protein
LAAFSGIGSPNHSLYHPEHIGRRQDNDRNGDGCDQHIFKEGPHQDQEFTDKTIGPRQSKRREREDLIDPAILGKELEEVLDILNGA